MKNRKPSKVKIPIYFDKIKDAPALAILEKYRILSETELPMSKFIKFMAVEFCLEIEKRVRAQVEAEKAKEEENAEGSTDISTTTEEVGEDQGEEATILANDED